MEGLCGGRLSRLGGAARIFMFARLAAIAAIAAILDDVRSKGMSVAFTRAR